MNKGKPYLCNSVVGSANERAQSHWKGTETEVSICRVAQLGAVEAGIADSLARRILLTCGGMELEAAVACVGCGNDALESQLVLAEATMAVEQ